MKRSWFGVGWWRGVGLGLLAAAGAAAAVPVAAQVNQTMHYDGWILAAAHSPGLEGSIWRTDLWIVVDGRGSGPVNLQFCRSNADNTDAAQYTVEVIDGKRVIFFEDVVDHFLGIGSGAWVGAIHYTSDSPVQVWARVYSINADGTASYGQLIEGVPTADMSPDQPSNSDADVHQWLYAVRHTANGRFRVNIGVVNPTAVPGDYVIRVFDATGNNLPEGAVTESLTVPPFSMVQLNDPFAEVADGEWSNVQIRVINYAVGSGNFAYASVVDNATNDAFFVRGVKRLFPNE